MRVPAHGLGRVRDGAEKRAGWKLPSVWYSNGWASFVPLWGRNLIHGG